MDNKFPAFCIIPSSPSPVLSLFTFFFFTYVRRDRPPSPLSRAGRGRSCVEFRKLFIPPRKSFNREAALRAVPFSHPPGGALTCIMRYRAFRGSRNVFYLAATAVVDAAFGGFSRNSRGASFTSGKRLSRRVSPPLFRIVATPGACRAHH